ncbi:MAG: hypothetical protein N3E36_07375 [Sulfolobales archaeon]|nr:hypothetical protein [Sulfolobales archaeon]
MNEIIDSLIKIYREGVNVRNALRYLITGVYGGLSGYRFLESRDVEGKYGRSIHYLTSALTGLINTSDSISAHCERKGSSIFVEDILKELGTSCNAVFSSSATAFISPHFAGKGVANIFD